MSDHDFDLEECDQQDNSFVNRNENLNPGIKPIQKTNLLVKEHLDAPTNPAATTPTRDTQQVVEKDFQ